MRKQTSIQGLLNRIISAEALVLLVLTVILVLTKGGNSSKAASNDKSNESLNQPQVTSGAAITATPQAKPTSVPVPTTTPDLGEEEGTTNPQVTVTPQADVTPGADVTPEADATPGADVTPEAGTDGQDTTAGSPATDSDNTAQDGTVSVAKFLSGLSAPLEGTLIQTEGQNAFTYYMQTDSRWAKKVYGEGSDTIEEFGCGPTSLSMVISSMTSTKIDPVQMCQWSYESGYWFPQGGSLHTLIPDAAKAFGLKAEGVTNNSDAAQKLTKALTNGSMVIVLMGKGSFTNSGHFIVLRGITSEGKVLVGDPASEETTNQEWDMTLIVNEAKSWAAANGPFWIISK